MSTQSHNSQKILVSTRYTPKKSRGLHDIKADIRNSYIIIQECLFGLSGLEGGFLGLGVWYIAIESRYLLLKDKMTRKQVGSPLRFHFLQIAHFSLSNSSLTDQTAQRE